MLTNLRWSREAPTVPGWYWTRWPHDFEPQVVDVILEAGRLYAGHSGYVDEAWVGYEWSGPIEPPSEPAPRVWPGGRANMDTVEFGSERTDAAPGSGANGS